MSKDIEGLDEAIKNMNKMFIKSPVAVSKALDKVANSVLAESIQLTPVDTGTLRRSQKVTNKKVGIDEVSVEVRADTDYAVYVHENLQARHPQGQAKFLESAVNTIAPEIEMIVATGMRSVLKK